MKTSHRVSPWIPLLLSIAVAAGLLAGRKTMTLTSMMDQYPTKPDSKIEQLIQLIDEAYVDSLSTDDLIESIIPQVMDELDPHSEYITAKDLESVNEELEGSFSGIGVQFSILNDTVTVVDVVSGGPSEKIGIMAGDRIVTVNDSSFVGESMNNQKVMKTLRGEKGSTIWVGIKRETSPELLHYEITRGDIPNHSIDVSLMVEEGIGYISVNRFAMRTYEEFLTALAKLRAAGAKGLIIDLRGNSGGFMDAAINMVNEFLEKGDLIVYTEGKAYPRSEAYANGMGSFKDIPLTVLVDEFSASASEIFAGAIQDNDRGTIVGRRSFGKGLVQNQIPFADGSAVRLTIARYYTPSGRSVQKKYELGKEEEYQEDFMNRFLHGELDVQDSIKLQDSLRYETVGGRSVYGGGGIMPDLFVPRDTTGITTYLNSVINKGLIYQYAFDYSDKNRVQLSQYKTAEELQKHLDGEPMLERFVQFAQKKGVKRRPYHIRTSQEIILNQLYATIARNILGDEGFYAIYLQSDITANRAIDLLKKGEAHPTLPQQEVVRETVTAE